MPSKSVDKTLDITSIYDVTFDSLVPTVSLKLFRSFDM